MRNIWKYRKEKKVNIGILTSAIMLFGTVIWSIYGIQNITSANNKQHSIELEKSIQKSASLCYAIEGFYPPNLEYLEENYGIDVNKEEYVVHYEIFASNIAPEIKVFEIK